MAYTKAAAHTVELSLFDAYGDPITTGTVTAEISKGSIAYTATDGTATHVDEELWTLAVTGTEADCDRYRIRVTHDDLAADIVLTDQANTVHGVNVTQVDGEAAEVATGWPTEEEIRAEMDANSEKLTSIDLATGTTLPAAIEAIESGGDSYNLSVEGENLTIED